MNNKNKIVRSVIFVIAIIYMLGVCLWYVMSFINKSDSHSNHNIFSQKDERYKTIEDPWTLNGIGYGYICNKEYDKAMPFLLKAAEKNQVNALNNLGWMYHYGYGVKQDYKKAC